jgi:cell division protein ZapE
MILVRQYEAAIAKGEINDDAMQLQVLLSLQRLVDDLHKPLHSWFSFRRKKASRGIYLHGPVGVGKTFLLDLFYQHVGEKQKARFHFHHFMQQVDSQLRSLQGQQDPLRQIAANLAKQIRLLCLDEFLLEDIAYALILAELLPALLANGVILVITSNTSPDNLYPHGVRRERFLPTIVQIKTHCEVLCLPSNKDYRFGRKSLAQAYVHPLGPDTDQILAKQFTAVAQRICESGTLSVQNRDIPYMKCGERAVWFDFKLICNLPRSKLDYLEIADRFDVVFISGIPALTTNDLVAVILLIHFVDVMYDRGIQLVISAAVPLQSLYLQGEMSEDFKRTLSRLQEMQAKDFLRRHPRRA